MDKMADMEIKLSGLKLMLNENLQEEDIVIMAGKKAFERLKAEAEIKSNNMTRN